MALQTSRFTVPASLLGITLLLLGCQGESRPEGMPELHPVTLTILQQDEPLTGASIRLIPEEGTSPWGSGGYTDENGVAVIRTHGKHEGVPAGSYKITVSKIEMPASVSPELSLLDAPPTAQESSYDLVAPEYTYPNQTPLRLEVTAGENRQELDLGAAVRIERQGPPSP